MNDDFKTILTKRYMIVLHDDHTVLEYGYDSPLDYLLEESFEKNPI